MHLPIRNWLKLPDKYVILCLSLYREIPSPASDAQWAVNAPLLQDLAKPRPQVTVWDQKSNALVAAHKLCPFASRMPRKDATEQDIG